MISFKIIRQKGKIKLVQKTKPYRRKIITTYYVGDLHDRKEFINYEEAVKYFEFLINKEVK